MGTPMTRIPRLPRTLRLALVFVVVWLVSASPASANQPPGPQMFLSEILILPLMMLLTALAGGYAIMRAAGIKGRRWLIALAVLGIFLSGIHEGYSALLMLIFGSYALIRGTKLAVWGVKALRPPAERPAHLSRARSVRLLSGALLIWLTAILLAGMNFAFLNWWPDDFGAERDLKRVVAYELQRGLAHLDALGQPQFEAPLLSEPDKYTPSYASIGNIRLSWRGYASDFKLGPQTQSFQVWIWPRRMPPFPYNYLITLPSFYADQTGQLRVIRVHKSGQRCPPDAPVYYRVRPEDAQPSP